MKSNSINFVVAIAALSIMTAQPAFAEDQVEDNEKGGAERISRITVAESRVEALKKPGSVDLLIGEDLDQQLYGIDDIHRVLRQIPGVNIQEEEGYGLRPNIGFRGAPNERSTRVTLMEDGILIAPAPYSAPAAYYFPPVGRMEGVEVTKGPGQIKYGPYTTGGALNLFSSSIPEETLTKAKIGMGSDNLVKAHVKGGNAWKHGGFLAETYQFYTDGFKDLDNGADTGVEMQDYQLKGRLNTDPEGPFYQQIEYKFGTYSQDSNETYLGLTDEDFGNTPFRRYSGSQLDNMDVNHVQNHVWHYIEFSEDVSLKTALYSNETNRNWYRLQTVGGIGIGAILDRPDTFQDELVYIQGGDSPDGIFGLRENKRDYESRGVQTSLQANLEVGETTHAIEAGARFHADKEDRFQREDRYTMTNGTLVLDELGAPGSQANRVVSANAWAFYAQDAISISDWTITPGLRYERINYKREDYGRFDPNRTGVALERTDNNIDALIPGGSVDYEFMKDAHVFVGIHRGFSPPGAQDNPDVEEEESINYELGTSYQDGSLYSKGVLFYTDYDNLLGADTFSSGGTGSGDLFNGGEVDVFGFELSAGYDLVEYWDMEFAVPLKLSYTYTNAEFGSTFQSGFFGSVEEGDEVPYIPLHQGYVSIGVEYESAEIYLEGYFTDSMKTVAGEVGIPDRTDSYAVCNLVGNYTFNELISVFVSLENLFDREYVVARRPAGARPGLPFTVVGGVEVQI